jgi:hypothetical protein
MKMGFPLLALLVAGRLSVQAAQPAAHDALSNRILWIDPSSMPVAKGKATLTMGMLQRTNGIYSGDYKIKVTPYFFKNQKGTVAIVVSDASLARMAEGKVQEVIGTATTGGKGGKRRYVDAIATPIDINHGTVKLWIVAGPKKIFFETNYHFAKKQTEEFATQTTLKNTTDKLP